MSVFGEIFTSFLFVELSHFYCQSFKIVWPSAQMISNEVIVKTFNKSNGIVSMTVWISTSTDRLPFGISFDVLHKFENEIE